MITNLFEQKVGQKFQKIFRPKMLLSNLNVMTYEIKIFKNMRKKKKNVTCVFFQFYDLATMMRVPRKI